MSLAKIMFILNFRHSIDRPAGTQLSYGMVLRIIINRYNHYIFEALLAAHIVQERVNMRLLHGEDTIK